MLQVGGKRIKARNDGASVIFSYATLIDALQFAMQEDPDKVIYNMSSFRDSEMGPSVSMGELDRIYKTWVTNMDRKRKLVAEIVDGIKKASKDL